MSAAEHRVTMTGGRDATTRRIPPQLALAVTMPSVSAPEGWKWSALTALARLESGHTPSRKHPEYWGGDIPWVSIGDAKINHGRMIADTIEKTNSTGIENSSARVLPARTVCLSRTASVGYVVVMGRPMATSQDFVNWVCSKDLEPEFLKYLFIAEGEGLLRFASGAVHQTIYFPEVKAFHICHPPAPEQRRIVAILDEAFASIVIARANAEKNLRNARELFKRHLSSVFVRERQGWLDGNLDQVVDERCTLSYGIVQPGNYYPNGLPIVRPVDMTTKIVRVDGLKRIDRKLADSYQRTTLQGGELLLCVRGSTGTVSVASADLQGANVTRGIVPIVFDEGVIGQDFGYYLMCSALVQDQIRAKTYGAALMQINIRDLRNIQLTFPSLIEQRALTATLNRLSVDTQRLESIYERKLAAIDELKQSLLNEAFSGKL